MVLVELLQLHGAKDGHWRLCLLLEGFL